MRSSWTGSTVTLRSYYHALSVDGWDAEDLNTAGSHYGSYASEEKDGHGRVIRTTERVGGPTGAEARYVESEYLASGELAAITRRRGTDTVVRTMQYDSLGRMTHNLEPSTSSGTHHWRYVYDDSGNLQHVDPERALHQLRPPRSHCPTGVAPRRSPDASSNSEPALRDTESGSTPGIRLRIRLPCS